VKKSKQQTANSEQPENNFGATEKLIPLWLFAVCCLLST